MTLGLVGRKCGMTRIFQEDGTSTPVTVVEIKPNFVVCLKKPETDGYTAVQVTTGEANLSKLTKPLAGHYAKAEVKPGRGLYEFRVDADTLAGLSVGEPVTLSIFSAGQKVDVTGLSKGRGFSGVVRRWNFSQNFATHGNSLSHRTPGSIGQNQTPGRVFKGKKMAGHWGCEKNTIQNLEVVKVNLEQGFILIKGGLPGAPGGYLRIRPAVKTKAAVKSG